MIRDEYRRSFILSVVIHIILFALLLINISFISHKRYTLQAQQQSPVIQATTVEQAQVEATISKMKAEQERKRAAELAQQMTQQKQADLARQQQEQKIADAKAAAAKAQQQQLVAQETAARTKLQIAKEKKRQAALKKQALLAQQKAQAEKQRQAQLAAQAAKQKALQEQKMKDASKLMDQELNQEQQGLTADKTQQFQGEIDKYKAMIVNAIGRKWLVPDNANRKSSCKLLIHLAPGGMVIDVQLVSSSGDAVLDRSAVAAVYKASPLPVPTDPEVFDNFRELSLTVRPEEIVNN